MVSRIYKATVSVLIEAKDAEEATSKIRTILDEDDFEDWGYKILGGASRESRSAGNLDFLIGRINSEKEQNENQP